MRMKRFICVVLMLIAITSCFGVSAAVHGLTMVGTPLLQHEQAGNSVWKLPLINSKGKDKLPAGGWRSCDDQGQLFSI